MPTNMADPFGKLGLFLAAAKDCGIVICLPTKPITTKHQSVFWLVSHVGHMRWHLLVDITGGGQCCPCGQNLPIGSPIVIHIN